MNRKHSFIIFVIVLALLAGVAAASAQGQRPQDTLGTMASTSLGTSFTYQGQLKNASGPVNDHCDFQFSLWEAAASTAELGRQTRRVVAFGRCHRPARRRRH